MTNHVYTVANSDDGKVTLMGSGHTWTQRQDMIIKASPPGASNIARVNIVMNQGDVDETGAARPNYTVIELKISMPLSNAASHKSELLAKMRALIDNTAVIEPLVANGALPNGDITITVP